MRTEHLRCLIALAQSGSINKASKQLYTTPQNISRLLKQVEDEMGFPIVLRQTQGIHFTKYGNEVLQAAEDTIARFENIQLRYNREMHNYTSIYGNIFICCPLSYNTYYIDEIINKFSTVFPNINISFVPNTNFFSIIDKINESPDSSIGLTLRTSFQPHSEKAKTYLEEFYFKKLQSDKLVALLSMDSPFSSDNAISIKQLAKEKLIINSDSGNKDSMIATFFQQHGYTFDQLSHTTKIPSNYFRSISEGRGIGIMARDLFLHNHAARQYKIKHIDIVEDSSIVNYLIYRKNVAPAPPLKYFLDFIKDYQNNS